MSAELRVAKIFGDGMVLQQQQSVNIWGWADSDEKITVTGSWDGNAIQVSADASGGWKAVLHTPDANLHAGPFTITIEGSNRIELKDVWIGEVWIVAGQSNMAMPLSGWKNQPVHQSEAAISRANLPQLRLRAVGHRASGELSEDVADFWMESLNQWAACTPESVKKFSAVGFFFGEQLLAQLNVPIGLIQVTLEGTYCESWTPAFELEQLQAYRGKGPWMPKDATDKHHPSVLWNGMVYPIAGYSMRGVVWYQGESNVDRPAEFSKLFPRMIEGWRRSWGQENFPFGFVQIAPWSGYSAGALPEFWEAQGSALFLKNTGMVPTLDLVGSEELDALHPSLKHPIGERLAAWALAEVYGIGNSDWLAPIFASMTGSGGEVNLNFKSTAGGLRLIERVSGTGFEVAGPDGHFHSAEAHVSEDQVILRSSEVSEIRQARYAWSNSAQPTLFGTAEVPAFPFRTQPASHVISNMGTAANSSIMVRAGRIFTASQDRAEELLASGIEVTAETCQIPGFWAALAARMKQQEINLVCLKWHTQTGGSMQHSAQFLSELLTRFQALELPVAVSFHDLQSVHDAQVLKTFILRWIQSPYVDVFQKFQEQVLLQFEWGGTHGTIETWQDAWTEVLQLIRKSRGGLRCPLLVTLPQLTPIPDLTELLDNIKFASTPESNVILTLASEDFLPSLGAFRAAECPVLVMINSNELDPEITQQHCRNHGVGWIELLR
ncbi:MAG: sialate O-acetylesterase [Puniceicoccaceae bacterium]